MDVSAVICDKVIDAHEAKSKQILMKRKQPAKWKTSIFCLHFY